MKNTYFFRDSSRTITVQSGLALHTTRTRDMFPELLLKVHHCYVPNPMVYLILSCLFSLQSLLPRSHNLPNAQIQQYPLLPQL